MSSRIRVRAVTLDATHTLLHAPRLAEIYTEVLQRHGATIGVERLAPLLTIVWQELGCRHAAGEDRLSAHAEGARGFWREYLERLCALAELPPPSRFAAAELFDRFAHPDAWEVYPDVEPALAELRRRGLRLAVVSNWDDRLPRLLERLALAGYFDAIVHSTAIGIEKPHPAIFTAATTALGTEPEETVHVGDSRRDDVEGAEGAGLGALWLERSGKGDLADLRELPRRLGLA